MCLLRCSLLCLAWEWHNRDIATNIIQAVLSTEAVKIRTGITCSFKIHNVLLLNTQFSCTCFNKRESLHNLKVFMGWNMGDYHHIRHTILSNSTDKTVKFSTAKPYLGHMINFGHVIIVASFKAYVNYVYPLHKT